MQIQLKHLPHQTNAINAICKVLKDVQISRVNAIHQNPIIDLKDETISTNITDIWNGDIEDFNPIPKSMQRTVDDGILGIDAKLETGTGKTYVYTRLMYELNKQYGFNKFILLVPSTPIKEGTKNFIEANYSKMHFADIYPNVSLKLQVLNAQKNKSSGRKMFPSAIAEYARGTRLEKNRIHVLLTTDKMLLSKATMEKDDYDQTLLGEFTQPYKAIEETRPIVIIDEPHRFKRENKAYQCITDKIKPQCVIRFGATFPYAEKSEEKDYNNLVYNLGACEAFNEQLVKGVAVQTLEDADVDDVNIKLMKVSHRPKSCVFRNEKTKKTFDLVPGDSLSIIDESFSGISVESIGKSDECDVSNGLTLSNGHVITVGDIIYSSIYGTTYQELMMKQAIEAHFIREKENFLRGNKIKTLSLFFIDSIYSYRGSNNDGKLRLAFEKLLTEKLKEEISKINQLDKMSRRILDYKDYLEASLKDIKKTNGGYFSEDNSKSDEDIQEEVDKILRDKESLISFKGEDNQWNTMRFIFSKWTLREGWDNPNVFTIAKLRSSGSEISKLQEVGRGLRLPVDELGNRISGEQFYLNYIIDFSEKKFADNLVNEINADVKTITSIRDVLSKVAKDRGVDENVLFAELLIGGYVDKDQNIIEDMRLEMMDKYPEFNTGLQQGKVIDTSKKKLGEIKIREERFSEIKELWDKINQKYYLMLDEIDDEELGSAVTAILESNIFEEQLIHAKEKRTTKGEDGLVEMKESTAGYHVINSTMPYGEFLRRIQSATGIPMKILHRKIVEYNSKSTINTKLFNKTTLQNFIAKFQEWLESSFIKKFSYKKLEVSTTETTLTDIDGNVKEVIPQGSVGIMRSDSLSVPSKFLYDSFIYDSPKERETIENSNIDEVVVFGKIPRSSIRVPLYYGGTTSPDFMYVLKKPSGEHIINFIVETKDVKKDSGLRDEEKMRIKSAKEFFETLKEDGLNVSFEKQMKKDDIVTLIRKLVK
ncbi:type III restriction-modification system endonuclease [Mesobacillus sp.]|uniref:type III restriction-modification system endonuclease n=1 Tax=Mesobacillus sp. TaxID=2675271 RepID=UPI0039F12BC1